MNKGYELTLVIVIDASIEAKCLKIKFSCYLLTITDNLVITYVARKVTDLKILRD
jgi:hypothetical protein